MKKGKVSVHASVSPMRKKQLDVLVNSDGMFSSMSDAVDQALGLLFYTVHSGNMCDCAEQYGLTLDALHGNMAGQSNAIMG